MSIPTPHDPDPIPGVPQRQDKDKGPPEDVWRDHKPGFEINQRGQLRTKDYKPPETPVSRILRNLQEALNGRA